MLIVLLLAQSESAEAYPELFKYELLELKQETFTPRETPWQLSLASVRALATTTAIAAVVVAIAAAAAAAENRNYCLFLGQKTRGPSSHPSLSQSPASSSFRMHIECTVAEEKKKEKVEERRRSAVPIDGRIGRLTENGSPPAPTTELPALRGQLSREQSSQSSAQTPSGVSSGSSGARKWPSFTMRRSGRLSSASSALAAGAPSTLISSHGTRSTTAKLKFSANPCESQDGVGGGGSLLRSFSADRHRISTTTTPKTPACTVDPATPTIAESPQKPFVVRSSSSPHRKSSETGRCAEGGFGPLDRVDSVESTGGEGHRNSLGLQKTKKVITSFFFGKHSKKGRSFPSHAASTPQYSSLPPPLPPSSLSSHQETSAKSRIESLPPSHPAAMADISEYSS
ncbi:hypothetical protein Aperf_G00000092722 [Anoplocephala perfoliata]